MRPLPRDEATPPVTKTCLVGGDGQELPWADWRPQCEALHGVRGYQRSGGAFGRSDPGHRLSRWPGGAVCAARRRTGRCRRGACRRPAAPTTRPAAGRRVHRRTRSPSSARVGAEAVRSSPPSRRRWTVTTTPRRRRVDPATSRRMSSRRPRPRTAPPSTTSTTAARRGRVRHPDQLGAAEAAGSATAVGVVAAVLAVCRWRGRGRPIRSYVVAFVGHLDARLARRHWLPSGSTEPLARRCRACSARRRRRRRLPPRSTAVDRSSTVVVGSGITTMRPPPVEQPAGASTGRGHPVLRSRRRRRCRAGRTARRCGCLRRRRPRRRPGRCR